MERTSGKSSLGTIAFMTGAVVCAVVAGLLLAQLLQGKYAEEPVEPIVVARRSVPAGQQLQKEDLRLAEWPRSSIPPGAFRTLAAALETKRVPLIPFVLGEAVLDSHLAKPNSGFGIAAVIKPGQRAMSIETDKPIRLARLLYPGAQVDVLVTMAGPPDVTGRLQTLTSVVLQDITVAAVGEDIDQLTISNRRRKAQGSENSRSAGEERDARAIVTILLTPEESARVALASRIGKVDIVLRNPHDRDKQEVASASSAELQAFATAQGGLAGLTPAEGAGGSRIMGLTPRGAAAAQAPAAAPPPARARAQAAPRRKQPVKESSTGSGVIVIQ